MCAFADSVSVEVGTDAHPVAVGTGVKWRRIKTDGTSINRISVSPTNIGNLPNQYPICCLDVENILPQTNIIYCDTISGLVVLSSLHDIIQLVQGRLNCLNFLFYTTQLYSNWSGDIGDSSKRE